MTLADFKQEYITWYKEDLADHLNALEESIRPSQARIEEIVNSSYGLPEDAILRELYEEIKDRPESTSVTIEAQRFRFRTPKWLRDLDPTKTKAGCIATHSVVAAAVLAAWVASGGTLTVGMAAGGATITEPILAALIGGGGVAAVARAFC